MYYQLHLYLDLDFEMTKQKAFFLPENLDQLRDLNMGLALVFILWIDILKSDFNDCNSFALLWVVKVTLEHKVLYQLLQILLLDLQQY